MSLTIEQLIFCFVNYNGPNPKHYRDYSDMYVLSGRNHSEYCNLMYYFELRAIHDADIGEVDRRLAEIPKSISRAKTMRLKWKKFDIHFTFISI